MAASVKKWLEAVGLAKFVDVFAEHEIIFSDLAQLNEDDLKEMGLPIGPRRRALKAISELDVEEVAASETAGTKVTGRPTSPTVERRHLTILFCDLVGSTELSQDLDPEDMRDIMRSYQNMVAGEIARYEGHVAKFMGDGVMAFFGYPQAHEDDAERAIRSALAIVDAVPDTELGGDKPLRVRVGIATGQVVVGDLVGQGGGQEDDVVGDTPNLAARLETTAAPNCILVSDETRRLAGNAFDYSDLGMQSLKGLKQPARVWKVDNERALESRFEAREHHWTAIVGRDHEVEILLDRWQQAKDCEGQVVLLSGEAGIGKSRVLEALVDRLSSERHTRLRYQCSPYHTNSALYPIIGELERSAGFTADNSADEKIAKLEHLLVPRSADVEISAALFASLLSLPADKYPPLGLTPQEQKARTLDALTQQISAQSHRQPVLFLFEDTHWSDPTTLEFLELLVEGMADQPILALITHRPEFEPPWQRYDHVSSLSLNRLSRNQCIEMVLDLTAGKALPDDVLDQIIEKTDGVPLFVEELTKAVLESGLLRECKDRFELAGPLPPLAIPSTLQDSLMARLDRLAPVKEVAQIGAAIGREFSYRLISAVSEIGSNALEDALAQLAEAELIFRRGQGVSSHYIFKHALVQDAAYESLLKSKRQQLHKRIAEILESDFGDLTEVEPETLAHHYTEAGLAEPAIRNWLRAGQLAARRASNLEAIEYLHRALALLESLPEGRARHSTELEVLTHLGPPLMVIKGWAAPEVGKIYERANELAGRLEKSADLVPPLVGIWLYNNARGRYDVADTLTQQLFHVAKATSDEDLLLQAHHSAWPIPMFRGAFGKSNTHIDKGLALYDFGRHKHHALVYMGHDPAVCAYACGAQAFWATGSIDRADKHAQDALELARRLGHAPTLAFALWYVSGSYAARGDSAMVLAHTEELLGLSQEQKLVQTEASAQFLGGWAMAQTGQVKEGLEQMSLGFAAWDRIGARSWLQLFNTLYADALLCGQRYTEALAALDRALGFVEEIGERWWESRIHHLRAEALLHEGDAASAETSLQMAIQIAQAQEAKSWELCATTRLAELWAEEGKRGKARDLLTPIYGRFTEGLDTPDLVNARALLDELS